MAITIGFKWCNEAVGRQYTLNVHLNCGESWSSNEQEVRERRFKASSLQNAFSTRLDEQWWGHIGGRGGVPGRLKNWAVLSILLACQRAYFFLLETEADPLKEEPASNNLRAETYLSTLTNVEMLFIEVEVVSKCALLKRKPKLKLSGTYNILKREARDSFMQTMKYHPLLSRQIKPRKRLKYESVRSISWKENFWSQKDQKTS